MKGIVFVALADMIQEKYGHRTWNEIIAGSKVESQGVYTTAETYKDEEATKILDTICKKLNADSEEVLNKFGIYLIKYFQKRYPYFFEDKSYEEFMKSVDAIIHQEIKKLSPNAHPPKIHFVSLSNNKFKLHYSSKRRLCALARGLTLGAADIYGSEITIEHTNCMHNGNKDCEFTITLK